MSILDAIVRDKRDEVARRKTATPRSSLERACAPLAPPRDFAGALRPLPGDVALIAEVKKASPSRGTLAPPGPWDPIGLARIYADNGAAAISVLTDEKYFQGRLEVLTDIHGAVGVPILRKDFTIDEYQLWESRAAGAAIYAADRAASIEQGMEAAREAIDCGRARSMLERVAAASLPGVAS